MIIKKFVINLNRRPDRLTEFYLRSGNMVVERFPAFDGREFNGSHELLDSLVRRHPKKSNIKSIFGCWSSHLSLWNKLVDSDADAFAIFEDDAFFNGDINFVLNNINMGMDIIYFGGKFSPNYTPNLDKWEQYGEFWLPLPGADVIRTTHAYAITRMGAEKILNKYKIDLNSRRGITAIDAWLNENRFNFVIPDFFPHACHSPRRYKSDIQI
jgi:hypothetical protein